MHGGRHREVGLAGAGGTDAKDERVFENGLKVEFLAERLGNDGLALGLHDDRLGKQGAELGGLAAGDALGEAMKIRRADGEAERAGLVEQTEKRLAGGNGVGFAVEADPIFARDDDEVQETLGMGEVLRLTGVELAQVTGGGEVKGLRGHERRRVRLLNVQ